MKYSQFLWSVKTVFGPLGSSYLEDLYLPELGATAVESLEKGVSPRIIWEQMLKETSQNLDLVNIYRWDTADIKNYIKENS